jgi:acetyltransferase-like isoleucine patch superfamily enzyme
MANKIVLNRAWLAEALRRLVQIAVGNALMDFPGLLQLRMLILRLVFDIDRDVIIGKNLYFIQPHGYARGLIRIGRGTRINHRVEIDYSGGVEVGRDVWISQNVLIETHEHVLGPGVKEVWPIARSPLQIADGAWIGANVTILPGVSRIGRRAIVGAGSVVTRDVPDETVVAGAPAKPITRLEPVHLAAVGESPIVS